MTEQQISYVCLKCFAEYTQAEACQQYYRCWRWMHAGIVGKDGSAGIPLRKMEVKVD